MRQLPERSAVGLGLVVVLAAVAGCADPDSGVGSGSTRWPAIHDAAAAKARWTAAQPRHYRFTYLPSCFCTLVTGRLTVSDGKVVAWVAEPTAGSYDPATGIPVSAKIDWMKNAYDDEMAWQVNSFEDLDHPSTATTVPPPAPSTDPTTAAPSTGAPTS